MHGQQAEGFSLRKSPFHVEALREIINDFTIGIVFQDAEAAVRVPLLKLSNDHGVDACA
jgi:hypothetical protein